MEVPVSVGVDVPVSVGVDVPVSVGVDVAVYDCRGAVDASMPMHSTHHIRAPKHIATQKTTQSVHRGGQAATGPRSRGGSAGSGPAATSTGPGPSDPYEARRLSWRRAVSPERDLAGTLNPKP